jgi:predicted AAA+ superfamily ATPase
MVRRQQERRLGEALEDTPVVMIVGPRQCGKSTLAQAVGEGRELVTLDDPRTLSTAKLNPVEFLRSFPGPVTIDEVQRATEIFLPLKAEVDRRRTPGKYLLTGSANVLQMPKIGDSLAGRMEVLSLLPFSQGEIEGAGDGFVDQLFAEEFKAQPAERLSDLFSRIAVGGYPEPSLRKSAERRAAWFDSYIRTILDRDIRDIANIEALAQIPRLLTLLALRAGTVLNANSLSADLQIPYSSLKRYLELLETLYLVHRTPAWSNNFRGRAVTKSPKLYLVDTGLLCNLANLDSRTLASSPDRHAPILDNFVAMELRKQCEFGKLRPWLMHFRTVRNLEVDFVLETRDQRIAGVEVRSSSALLDSDADGLRYLQEIAGDLFVRGVILYHGEEIVRYSPQIIGLPIQCLWDMQHS